MSDVCVCLMTAMIVMMGGCLYQGYYIRFFFSLSWARDGGAYMAVLSVYISRLVSLFLYSFSIAHIQITYPLSSSKKNIHYSSPSQVNHLFKQSLHY